MSNSTIPELNEYLVIVTHRDHDEKVEVEGIRAVNPEQARNDAMQRPEWPLWAEPREGRRNPPPGTRVVVWDVSETESYACRIQDI